MRDQDLKTGVRHHRSRAVTANEELVPRVTRSDPSVLPEDLAHHTKFERGESVVDNDRNLMVGTSRPTWARFGDGVGLVGRRLFGRYVAHNGNPATFDGPVPPETMDW